MFSGIKQAGTLNTGESNKPLFPFNLSSQTSTSTTSQPAFSFGTQLQQETNKTQNFSFTGTQIPQNNPSTNFSFGNLFQKTAPINPITDPSQAQKTQNEPFSQINQTLQSPQTFSRTSRYSDFPKEGKDFLDEINHYITTQTQISDHLQSRAPHMDELIHSVPRDVEEVSTRLDQAVAALTSDINQLMSLKTTVEKDCNNAKLSRNAIVSTPMPYIDSSRTKDPILAYFENTSDEIEKKMNNYAETVEYLEKHLEYLEKDHSEEKGNPEALLNTLKAEYDFLLALSSNAAEVHDKIKQLGTHNLITNVIGR
ncbi:hypothetical protein PCK1_000957 [Pneumocystis canis]|nr:hypothetical protein PCK1_000957 [Pneumocystis canis]